MSIIDAGAWFGLGLSTGIVACLTHDATERRRERKTRLVAMFPPRKAGHRTYYLPRATMTPVDPSSED